MPNGNNPDWLKKELTRKLCLAKIGATYKGKKLIDDSLELLEKLVTLLRKK